MIFEIEIHGMRLWSLLYFDKTQGTLSITLDILKLKFALESKIFNFVRILMVTNHAYYDMIMIRESFIKKSLQNQRKNLFIVVLENIASLDKGEIRHR